MEYEPTERPAPHILVVEPDGEAAARISGYLHLNGFNTHVASSAAAMDRLIEAWPISTVLLNLMLRDEAGLSVCRRLANDSGPPVVAMSEAPNNVDAIVALEIGADDYVARDVDLRELLARIRALLRRTTALTVQKQAVRYSFADFQWDMASRRLVAPSGETVQLTPCEVSLLNAFLQSGGEVLSRDTLLALLRGQGTEKLDRAIDSHVSRLRRKLAGYSPVAFISTVHGAGYRWEAEAKLVSSTGAGAGAGSARSFSPIRAAGPLDAVS